VQKELGPPEWYVHYTHREERGDKSRDDGFVQTKQI